jgi:uncharacterized repeat protein (TIGR01451 family)
MRNSRTLRPSTLTLGVIGLLAALTCAVALSGCPADKTTIVEPPVATLGSLNVNANPSSSAVIVTGPQSFSRSFTGNQFIPDLVPGQYTASATALGFGDAVSQINVVAGQTSTISLILQETALPLISSLNVNVNPASATVVVIGPSNFSQTFTGNQFLTDLEPGQYTAAASAPGFGDAAGDINVSHGQTSSLSLQLQAKPIIDDAPRVVYRDGAGNLIPIDSGSLQSGQFVFYTWLEDKPLGILTSKLLTAAVTDPGRPLVSEQMESAPSYTQNLAASWVGYKDRAGVVRPVIGADVRWEIDQWWTGRVNSMQFGTSDDNRVALGYGVNDDQADTRTNNARLETERFPLLVSDYPLYNVTGVGTPFVDGFTWVTLFSPDKLASGRIVAVATIHGEEIGKQIIYKDFSPQPELEITKTVSADIVNLVGGVATVTWTITVTNVGLGDATSVDLNDFLASGVAANYTAGALPTGSVAVGDGFTLSFPLPAADALVPGGNVMTLTFTATVTEPGTYCNEAEVLEFEDATHTWNPVDLNAQACFTALEANVSIVKDFVAADGITSLGKSRTVAADEPARLRIRVINSGTGAATGVLMNDVLSSGDAAAYRVLDISEGTLNTTDGFDADLGTLAAGATETLFLTVAASTDGVYCDTASVTVTTGTVGIGSDTACLTVATPELEITKVDAPHSVLPGGSYTSTIVVRNTGNATARDVVISDLLGLNSAANVLAIYVSSSLNGVAGTIANGVIMSATISIPAGGSVTFIIVSRIPLGAAAGTYCDTASVTSSNADSPEPATDCVEVPAFSALQTQLIDLDDPVAAGSQVTFFSVMYVEALSNEGVSSNEFLYSFGLVSPDTLGIPGVFRALSTRVYVDNRPVRDPATGLVISDTSNPSAVLLTPGAAYTLDNTTPGLQRIVMTPNLVLQRDTAFYVVHVVLIPDNTPANRMYTTSYIWDSVGLVNPANNYEASSSEPTTVLP